MSEPTHIFGLNGAEAIEIQRFSINESAAAPIGSDRRKGPFEWDLKGAADIAVRTSTPAASDQRTASARFQSDVILFALRIHLHDIGGLAKSVGIPAYRTTEEMLILAAWEKWGERVPSFLSGEFSFALWDRRDSRLFCCRDHLGQAPFYYWHDGLRFVFGPTVDSILQHPDIPRHLNRPKLAGYSVPGGQHFRHRETYFQGIMSLPGGSCMVVDRAGLREWDYWTPTIDAVSVPSQPEEAFQSVRELLFRSVSNSLRGSRSPVILLSGGLDSSALAAIAVETLEERNTRLLALASVAEDRHREQTRDERAYVEQFRNRSNIDIRYVTAPNSGPFDGIEDPRNFFASFTRATTYYLFEAFRRAACDNGSDVIITGNYGELGPTHDCRRYYLELAARFRALKLLHTALQTSAVRGISAARILAAELRGFVAPDGPRRAPFLLTRAFLNESDAEPFPWSRSLDHRQYQLDLIKILLRKHATAEQSMLGSLPVRYPFLDKQLLEFCLSAPGELKIRNGYGRYLIRGALDGMLPPELQWRTDKMPFSPDYAARYSAQLPKAKAFVASIAKGDPVRTIVDVPLLERLIATTPAHSWTALIPIPGTIRLICFLRQFHEFQP